MLFLGRQPILFMGNKTLENSKMKNEYSGGLYVKDACFVAYSSSLTAQTRNMNMARVYDWLNYKNVAIGGTRPAGGFEVEATIISLRDRSYGWSCLWGARLGTTGKVTRTNILIGSKQQISQGISHLSEKNAEYGSSIQGKKLNVRLICVPTTSEIYGNAYSGRLIVTDVTTGEVLTDNTEIWGDDFGVGKDAMFSTVTTFYRFQPAWFSRGRYANPTSNATTNHDFEGLFFGGAVYLNPTGADDSIQTRVPVQYLTPVKGGTVYKCKMINGSQYMNTFDVTSDGVVVEIANINDIVNSRAVGNRYVRMMYNCPNYNTAVIKYLD